MKTLFSFIFIVFIALSCNKPASSKLITIEGQLMSSCDVPAANKSGSIRTNDGLLTGSGLSLDFTTDENGYFKIQYSGTENLDNFTVRVQGSSDVLKVTNLGGNNKDLGKVYINPFPTNFIIKLDVQNPYTENDTLVMLDFDNPDPFANKLIPGPFSTGYLDSVFNYSFTKFPIHFSDLLNGTGPIGGVSFRIRSLPNNIGNSTPVYFKHAPICSGEFAEVTLVID
jgi:hypothetical protein